MRTIYRTNIEMPADLAHRWREFANSRDLHLRAVLETALREYLDRNAGGPVTSDAPLPALVGGA